MNNPKEIKSHLVSAILSREKYERKITKLYAKRSACLEAKDNDLLIILNNKENKYKSNRLRHIRLTNMYFVDFMEAFKILTFKSPINNIVRHADGFNLIFVHHILPYMYECDENIMKKNRSNAMNRLTYCKRNSSPSKTWIKNIDRAIEISEAYTYMCLYSSVILNRGSIINSAPSHE